MAEIIRMPKLSDTMTDGVVAEWHKNIGDEVESGELLAKSKPTKPPWSLNPSRMVSCFTLAWRKAAQHP